MKAFRTVCKTNQSNIKPKQPQNAISGDMYQFDLLKFLQRYKGSFLISQITPSVGKYNIPLEDINPIEK